MSYGCQGPPKEETSWKWSQKVRPSVAAPSGIGRHLGVGTYWGTFGAWRHQGSWWVPCFEAPCKTHVSFRRAAMKKCPQCTQLGNRYSQLWPPSADPLKLGWGEFCITANQKSSAGGWGAYTEQEPSDRECWSKGPPIYKWFGCGESVDPLLNITRVQTKL